MTVQESHGDHSNRIPLIALSATQPVKQEIQDAGSVVNRAGLRQLSESGKIGTHSPILKRANRNSIPSSNLGAIQSPNVEKATTQVVAAQEEFKKDENIYGCVGDFLYSEPLGEGHYKIVDRAMVNESTLSLSKDYGTKKTGMKKVVVARAKESPEEVKKDWAILQKLIAHSPTEYKKYVPKVYYAGEKNGSFHVVSKLIRGGDLTTACQELDNSQRLSRLAGFGRAVQFIHNANIIHRDIRGQNGLTHEGRGENRGEIVTKTYITDFGLSKDLDHPEIPYSSARPVKWAAPEVLAGETDGTKESDLFMFGMTIIEIMTNPGDPEPKLTNFEVTSHRLSAKEEGRESVLETTDSRYHHLTAIHPDLGDLVKALLSVDPANRPPIDEVCETLETITSTVLISEAKSKQISTSTPIEGAYEEP